ncbi:MAG: error-prone DNA polymerase [Candidatus Obscuribacterales bacterium]|nr:error-prone DNA polymerase [Candidatus Obscuribacterales bacterium]
MTNKIEYAELHCHSAFSLLDGASNPEDLVSRAKNIGLKALALTDHDELGGIPRFAHAAKELSLEAIIGSELTLEDDSHLTVLAENIDGYKHLCQLLSNARLKGPRGSPKISYEALANNSKGLIALSGCPKGCIPSAFAKGDSNIAYEQANKLRDIFPDSFYLELWDHELRQEALLNRQLLELSKSLKIPWVTTNNAHYASPGGRIIHDVLTCLRHEVTLETAGRRLRPNGNWYLKSPEAMARLWRHDLTGIKNSVRIAERCAFRLGALKPALPPFPVAHGTTHDQFLSKLVWEGATHRYPHLKDKHIDQINHELAVIKRLQLAPYFLIMWDIVRFAQSKGIAVQGRGSAANSAVCYCLSITAVDPIGMELLFERFLSEGREGPPDIDLDIAHQEREKVIQYVYERYGREHAAMVCEIATYRGKSAVRDAARVLGFAPEQADKLAKQSHYREALDAAQGLAAGGAREAGLDPDDRRVKLLLKVVAGLDHLPRHRSIHVGGFVLAAEPLGSLVPIEPASMEGRTVIQWDKDDLELTGMIKIDLLGLGMLTMIQEAVKLVKQHRNYDLDLAHLNMSDPNIYKMLQQADTIGVFQLESRAQMNILPRLHPTHFYDIIVSIALVRPGPIQGNIVHPYVRRRRGEEEVSYLHPSLEPILKRTLGVPLFQEQGMRLAVVAAGFTPMQADQLRIVMSHKRSHEKMAKICADLSAGMQANGFSEEAIETITHQLKAFANYGFPESHAASFSLLVYASAYLKKYYAPEFYCAILNAQPMGFYSPATLIRDAQRHGITVLPPDLAHSQWDCTLEQLSLRVGLRYVKGLGSKAEKFLKDAWQTGGPFTSTEDVCRRSGLGPKALTLLAKAGAFETLHNGRRQALWSVLALSKKQQRNEPLKKLLPPKDPDHIQLLIPEMTELETMSADYATLGLSTSKHPMTFYRSWAKERQIYSCLDVVKGQDGDVITVAGGVICRQRPGTAKGFVFITLEDETGTANVVIRPFIFDKYRKVILNYSFLAITGKLQLHEGVANVIADHIEELPQLQGNPLIPSRDFQ